MFKYFNFKFCVLVVFVVFAFYLFSANNALALNLPNKANFGESCSRTSDCASGLLCAGNTCVQCNIDNGDEDCVNIAEGAICDDGVCLNPSGNVDGAFCTVPAHCSSNNCKNNICQARVGSVSPSSRPSSSPIPNLSVQPSISQPPLSGGNPLGNFPGENLSAQDLTSIIIGLACWLARIGTLLPVIFIILAAFKFMTAGGEPKKYQDAKNNFKTVLLGILVIYGVYVIIATVANAVGITDFSFIPLVC